MRKITQRLTALMMASWLYVAGAYASDQFVPKEYSFKEVAVSSNVTINIPMTDLFTYPDGMDNTTNLDEAGVVATFEYANEEVVGLYSYEYYTFGKVQQLYLMRYGNKTGNADVKVTLDYKGVKVENTLKIDIIKMMANDDNYTIDLGETLKAAVINNDNFMNNSDKKTATLTIIEQPKNGKATIISAGDAAQDTIQYVPNEGLENYSFDELKYMVTLADGSESSSAKVKINIHKNAYASKVIDFLPAPGQFTNQLSKSNSAEGTLGTKGGMVSLGAFGGYVIYGFDQPIKNDPRNPYGVDFTIKGNSFIANLYGVWTEPGAVQVCVDLNGNGVPDPDEPWYELAGSDYWLSTTKKNVEMTYYNPNYDTRYTVPWSIKGKNGEIKEAGAVLTNQFHQQSYYPDPFDFGCDRDSLTFTGNIIRSSLDMSTPSYIEFYRAPAFGYTDNRGYDRTDLSIAHNPYFNDENGNATDGFDISWAVDKDGNHVELDHVDFVKVYCAGSANAGWLGEWSTEVLGVGITTPDPDYVPKDYYLNYIGITQLQVVRGQECQYEGFLFKNGRPVDEGEAKWWLSTDSVGTIDNTGLFKANAKLGKTWIYFSQKDDIQKDSIQIEIVDLKKVVIDIEGNASTVSNDSIKMIKGETIFIETQCEDSRSESMNGRTRNRYIYETFRWTTSNPEIGTINNGSFHGQKAGRTMLHVYSTTNPELSDSILVIVNEVPELTLISDPLRLPYYEPEGTIASNKLFTAGNNSTIYLDSVAATSKREHTIDLNKLNYTYEQGQYVADTLTFSLTHYGEKKEMKLAVIYGPDSKATKALLLYSDKNIVKSFDITDRSEKVKTVIDQLNVDTIQALVADGGFSFIAAGDSIFRYNTPEVKCTHKVQLANKAVADKMIAVRNLLVVASHTPAGTYSIDLYYKTDLEPIKTFTLGKPMKDMTVTNDKLYIIAATEDKSSMSSIDLKNFTLSREVSLNQKGLDVTTLVAKDDKVYGIRPYDPATEAPASILEFNTTNNTSKVVETDGIQAFFEGVPVAMKQAIGDSILLANYNGFSIYDTEKSEILDGIYMTGSNVYPTEAVYDSINNYFYVTYANEDASTYQGSAYYGKSMSKVEDIFNLGKTPANLTLQPELGDNEAPKPASRFTMSPNNYCYEMATSASAHSIWKTNFTDREGDFNIYLRGLEKHPWITQLDNLEEGDIRIQELFRGTVDKDSVITFQVEAIDKAGVSTRTDVDLTIKAEIVKPTLAEALKDTTIIEGTDTLRLDLKNVFNYTGSTYYVTINKSVTANDNPELIRDSIDTVTDSLVLIPAKDRTGVANLTVRYSVAKEGFGEKYAESTFAVTVKSNKPDGIDSTQADANSIIRILNNPFKDQLVVNVPETAMAELYNMNGQLIMQIELKAGDNTIGTTQLPAGTYLLKYQDASVKVIRE